ISPDPPAGPMPTPTVMAVPFIAPIPGAAGCGIPAANGAIDRDRSLRARPVLRNPGPTLGLTSDGDHDGGATGDVATRRTGLNRDQQPARRFLAQLPPAGHPYFLLLGLNLGPSLVITGALSAALWLRIAR